MIYIALFLFFKSLSTSFAGNVIAYKFHDAATDWEAASETCVQEGGLLLTVQSSQVLSRLLQDEQFAFRIQYQELWIGLRTEKRDCTSYTWVNGQPSTWTNWDYGEPNYCFQDMCIRMRSKLWRTSSCYDKLKFICERTSSTSSSVTRIHSENDPSTDLQEQKTSAMTAATTSVMTPETTPMTAVKVPTMTPETTLPLTSVTTSAMAPEITLMTSETTSSMTPETFSPMSFVPFSAITNETTPMTYVMTSAMTPETTPMTSVVTSAMTPETTPMTSVVTSAMTPETTPMTSVVTSAMTPETTPMTSSVTISAITSETYSTMIPVMTYATTPAMTSPRSYVMTNATYIKTSLMTPVVTYSKSSMVTTLTVSATSTRVTSAKTPGSIPAMTPEIISMSNSATTMTTSVTAINLTKSLNSCCDAKSKAVTCSSVVWGFNNGSVNQKLKDQIRKLQEILKVERNSTKLYIRSKISVYDSRRSSVTIGIVGILVLFVFFSCFVFADLPRLVVLTKNRMKHRHLNNRVGTVPANI